MNHFFSLVLFLAISFSAWTQDNPSTSHVWGDEAFRVVEQMPRFPGYVLNSKGEIKYYCEDLGTNEDIKKCSDMSMLEWINENLEYPKEAIKNDTEGTVVIQFIVEKDGSITGSKIVRDIGYGCGEAAKATIDKMNEMEKKWTPGLQRGQLVRVLFTLPVKFKL